MNGEKLYNTQIIQGWISLEVYKALMRWQKENPNNLECLTYLWKFYIRKYDLKKAMEVAIKIKKIDNSDYYIDIAKANNPDALRFIEHEVGEFGNLEKLKEIFPNSPYIKKNQGILSKDEINELLNMLKD